MEFSSQEYWSGVPLPSPEMDHLWWRLKPDSKSPQLLEIGLAWIFSIIFKHLSPGFPGGSDGKESAGNVRDPGSTPGLGRSPAEGNGNRLQYSLPREFHRQRSLAGYSQSMGSQRVGHDWATDTQALKGNKWQFFLGKIALSKVSNYSYHLKIINIWQSSPWRKKHYKIHKLYKFQTTKNGFTYNIKQTWKSKTDRTTRRKIHYQNGNFKYIIRKKCGILKVYTNT